MNYYGYFIFTPKTIPYPLVRSKILILFNISYNMIIKKRMFFVLIANKVEVTNLYIEYIING